MKIRPGLFILWAAYALLIFEAASWVALGSLDRFFGIRYRPIRLGLQKGHRDTLRHFADGRLFYRYSPSLGWTLAPDYRASLVYRTNPQGLRGLRKYSLDPPAGKVRVMAFGDSFTYCDDVPEAYSWEAQMEKINPALELLNFGVPGYGVDQAWLRYREEKRRFRGTVVLIGYFSENISRTENSFRPFYWSGTALPFSKPKFTLEADRLRLVPNPLLPEHCRALAAGNFSVLKRLIRREPAARAYTFEGRFDFLAGVRMAKMTATNIRRRSLKSPFKDGLYNPDSEAYRITLRILREFYREAEDDGLKPVIVLFCTRPDVESKFNHRPASYAPMAVDLNRLGLRVVDTGDILAAKRGSFSPDALFHGHHSPVANRMIAEGLVEYLVQKEIIPRSSGAPSGKEGLLKTEMAEKTPD